MAKAAATTLLLPPGGIVILLFIGLTVQRRWHRAGTLIIVAAAASLYMLSTPVASIVLTNMAGKFEPFSIERIGRAKAVVVLAGEDRVAPEYGGLTVGGMTLERLRLGAEIARRSQLPLLLSGGTFKPGDPSMAQLMASALQSAFALDATWLETESSNTHENASKSAKILLAHDVRTVVLVTDMFHMRRSVGEFARASIGVVPAPVNITPSSVGLEEFRPGVVALQRSIFALREFAAQTASSFGQ